MNNLNLNISKINKLNCNSFKYNGIVFGLIKIKM